MNTINALANGFDNVTEKVRAKTVSDGQFGEFYNMALNMRAANSSVAEDISTYAAENAENVGALSLEDRLREKYPNMAYHVFDASTSDWRERHDYPHYLLYQDTDRATEKVANWKPKGPNPPYNAFEAPKEITALGSIAPGSLAVVIHPDVQARMESDPEYADEIYNRIEAWIAFDDARNDAIMPGSSIGMCHAVAIGKDGNITNAQSHNPLSNRITQSGDDGMLNWWKEKMARQDYYFALQRQSMIEHSIEISQQYADLSSISSAKERLLGMMSDPAFCAALGTEIAGIPLQKVFDITLSQLPA